MTLISLSGWRQSQNACHPNSQNQLLTVKILFLSVVSIWEIQIKVALGKLDLMADLETTVDTQIKANSIQLLAVDLQHIYALSDLPLHHRDPFDRLLIAQSKVEKLTLASVDRAFDSYEVDLL